MNKITFNIGKYFLNSSYIIGAFFIFILKSLKSGLNINTPLKNIVAQIQYMFINTVPLIAITAIFTGAVLAMQSHTGFSRMHAESAIASIVVISITRELGPVLSGLMFAGRLGSSIAAEIATMRVTEQIDALEILGVNGKSYLIFPRIIAGMVSLPLLVIVADILGVFGGYIVSTQILGFESTNYIYKTVTFVSSHDVISGIIKAFFFGVAISSIGCNSGFNASRGAQGVGRATTVAVVSGSIMVLFLNYIITSIMFDL
jgi:phospholipid/cholesterol/gamma-HCH transport system permease protein